MNNDLLKLAGVQTKGAYYTNRQWKEKTGVSPINHPGYFNYTLHGLVYASNKYRDEYSAHSRKVRNNWYAIGVAH